MQMLKRVVFLLALCGPFIFTSCETSRVASGGPYHVTAYKPNDPFEGSSESLAFETEHLCHGR